MYKTLQSLRGLMALVIIVYHCYSAHGPYVDTFTPCAVSCFFMLSGFLMMLHHPVERLGQFAYKRFMWRRLVKIYPLHVLLTLVAVPSFGVNWKLGVHLALLQSWFPATGVHFGYNYVAWFVSSLMLCYVLYPVLGYPFANRVVDSPVHTGGGRFARVGGPDAHSRTQLPLLCVPACAPARLCGWHGGGALLEGS